nr:preprotein translocase subunit YajC [Acaricomes phytoseiuli]
MDVSLLLPLLLIAVLAMLMFRRSRQQQKTMTELQTKVQPGVDVMTSFGLFGRVVSIDDAENQVVLELSPGNNATVHRQAVTKVIESADSTEPAPVVPDDASSLTDFTGSADAGRPDRGTASPAEGSAEESQVHDDKENRGREQ